jgi:arginase family enzyme
LREIIAGGTVPLVLGGDDSIPPLLATALAEEHRFHVVTVDAHLLCRDEVDGEPQRGVPAVDLLWQGMSIDIARVADAAATCRWCGPDLDRLRWP